MIQQQEQAANPPLNSSTNQQQANNSHHNLASPEDFIKNLRKRYEKYPEPQQQRIRYYGLMFIILQVAFMISYGISAKYFRETSTQVRMYDVIGVVLQGFFAIFGFGLVLSVYRWGSWLGLGSALVVFAISAQVGPLFQNLWYTVFIKNFTQQNLKYTYQKQTNFISQFFRHAFVGPNLKIYMSSYSFRTVFLSCISILTFMTASIGRLSLMQVFKITLIYQVIWNLNFYLNIYVCIIRQGSLIEPNVFDAYGSSFCYLFAAFFGVGFTILTMKNVLPVDHIRNVMSAHSWIMSSLGTAFLFATFVFSSTNLIAYPSEGQNRQRLSMFLALCGSVVGTYSGSALANRGRVGHKDALIGTIIGGVAIGSAAPVVYNPGIALVIGSGTGFISGLLNNFISSKINKQKMQDVLGLFVPFMISSLIGSLVVPSAHYAVYIMNQINKGYYLWQSTSTHLEQYEATHVLIYAGISAGLGIVAGFIAGLACRWDTHGVRNASQLKIFDLDLGLYTPQALSTNTDNQQSNQALNPKNDQ